jgi:TPR repeat protein
VILSRPLLQRDQRRDIGYSALTRGAYQVAARLPSHTDTTVDPHAYGQIAALFYETADLASGRDWWQQAIATGHPEEAPKAMVNLGNLERQDGDLGQARHWWQQAIATGHPEAISRAQHELRALDRHETDRQRGEYFGRYGYLTYADPTLIKADDPVSGDIRIDRRA